MARFPLQGMPLFRKCSVRLGSLDKMRSIDQHASYTHALSINDIEAMPSYSTEDHRNISSLWRSLHCGPPVQTSHGEAVANHAERQKQHILNRDLEHIQSLFHELSQAVLLRLNCWHFECYCAPPTSTQVVFNGIMPMPAIAPKHKG